MAARCALAMYDFAPAAAALAADAPKPDLYRALLAAADALTAGEADGIANMANVAALMSEFLPNCNWVGFYRVVEGGLVLGPFVGRPACIRIPFGTGVCGAAAATGATQLVKDVHDFAGHIACDMRSRSELVVPVKRGGDVIAVIDLDSPEPARFDADDQAGIEALALLLSQRL